MTEQVKRSKIPYFFFAFFAVIIAVNIVYIYISKKTWRGVVTQDSYQKGINYNQTLEQVKKQNDLGWQVSIQYQRMTETKGAIMIKALDKNSVPLKDPQIYINFRRPTQEGFDFVKNIDPVDGVYRAIVDFPMSGQWDALVVVRSGDEVYQEVKRYVIQ